jgi:hypothetical protein
VMEWGRERERWRQGERERRKERETEIVRNHQSIQGLLLARSYNRMHTCTLVELITCCKECPSWLVASSPVGESRSYVGLNNARDCSWYFSPMLPGSAPLPAIARSAIATMRAAPRVATPQLPKMFSQIVANNAAAAGGRGRRGGEGDSNPTRF